MEKFEDYSGKRVNHREKDKILSLPEGVVLGTGTVLHAVKWGKNVVVGEEIKSNGGQGIIYRSEMPQYVIKLYNEEARTLQTEKKLKKMIQFENQNPSICWPVDVLETRDGVFVGFIMPYVEGKDLSSLTRNPPRIMKQYPGFSRSNQIDILIQTVELFRYLHEINVIVGDVKLENIMFNNEYKVTLVDVDSVQVEEFPCESSTVGYDSPEVILCKGPDNIAQTYRDGVLKYYSYYKDYYRNIDQERYALTVLIYRFLMNGEKPYNYSDWGKISNDEETYNDDELCVKAQFAYSEKEALCETAIDKNEEIKIWSHLPSFIKHAFVSTFANRERFSDEDWLMMLKRYKELLSSELRLRDDECDIPFADAFISFDRVTFSLSKPIERSGFTIIQAVSEIEKTLNKKWDRDVKMSITKALQDGTDITIGLYRFRLVYNIGVLKKVECDFTL